jgi:hypothetical protein
MKLSSRTETGNVIISEDHRGMPSLTVTASDGAVLLDVCDTLTEIELLSARMVRVLCGLGLHITHRIVTP